MMKSLAVLGFIFLVAASANAGLMISVNGVIHPPLGEIVLQPGETAVIGIHGDGLTPMPWVGYVFVEGPASIASHAMAYPGSLSEYLDLEQFAVRLEMTVEETLASHRNYLAKPQLTDLSFIVLVDGAVPAAPLGGLLVDNIIFHCDGLGDVTLSLMRDDFMWVYDTQVIQQIPEPMTLLLLGLGGLILARKPGGVHRVPAKRGPIAHPT